MSDIIICENYFVRILLPYLKNRDVTFLSPEDVFRAYLGEVSQQNLFDVYQNFAKKNFAYARYLANAALFFHEKERDVSPTDDLYAIVKNVHEHINFSPDEVTAHLLEQNKVQLYLNGSYRGLKQLLNNHGVAFSYLTIPALEETKPSVPLVCYKDFKEEALETLNQIAGLLNRGVNPSTIGICLQQDLWEQFREIADLFPISLSYENLPLKNVSALDGLLTSVKNGEAKKILEETYSGESFEAQIAFQDALRDYLEDEIEGEGYDEFLYDEMQDFIANRSLTTNLEGIKVASSFNALLKRANIFFLGLNSAYPASSKDSDFLSDDRKNNYSYLKTSDEKNEKNEKELIAEINHYRLQSEKGFSLVCSFHDPVTYANQKDGEKDVSPFLEDGKVFFLQRFVPSEENAIRYSKDADRFIYAALKDDHDNYGDTSPLFSSLDKQELKKGKKHSVNNGKEGPTFEFPTDMELSYSSMSDYFKCPYLFLIRKGYGINDSEEGRQIVFDSGTMMHKVFEDLLKRGEIQDFETSYEEAFNTKRNGDPVEPEKRKEFSSLNGHDQFYLRQMYDLAVKLKPEIELVCQTLGLNHAETEKKFQAAIKTGENLSLEATRKGEGGFTIKGYIDAFLKNEQNQFVILDYKSGNHPFNYDNAYYGFDIQLPLYAWVEETLTNQQPLGYYFVLPFSGKKNYLITNPASYEYPFSGVSYRGEDGQYLIQPVVNEMKKYIKDTNAKKPFTSEQVAALEEQLKTNLNSIINTLKNTKEFPVVRSQFVDETGFPKSNQCLHCPYEDCCYLNLSDSNQHRDLRSQLGESEEEENEH